MTQDRFKLDSEITSTFSDTADPWANQTSEQIIEELKKTIYSLESKFVALTPHLEYPVPVIFSDHVMALRQVRFPKSKKKRIRKKWSQREINFASRPGCYLIQKKIYMHSHFKESLLTAGIGCAGV